MSDLTNKYIEHEVEIRVIREVTGEKFKYIEHRFDKMDNKLNSLIALVISGILIPSLLHWMNIL